MTQGFLSTERLRTTPARLRTWSVALSVLLIAAGVFGFLSAQSLRGAAAELRDNTGPVLIESQGLRASIAEADAANTAVFLSGIDGGDEDRQQRGLYESALERAPRQIENISTRLDIDAPSHAALQTLGSQLTEYAGTVERARTKNSEGIDEATQDLRDALLLAGADDGMLSNVEQVNAESRDRLEEGVAGSIVSVFAGLLLSLFALLALLIAQFRLRRVTKRSVNPGLALATFVLGATILWSVAATLLMVADLTAAADDGYDSIEVIGEMQTTAFDFRTNEALAIVGTDSVTSEARNESIDRVNNLITSVFDVADSDRERATVGLLQTRWDRYVTTANDISEQLNRGNLREARALTIEASNDDFNGFNTTLEAVLLANRDQFNLGVQSANDRLAGLSLGMALLPLLAVGLVLAGYQPRINEYW